MNICFTFRALLLTLLLFSSPLFADQPSYSKKEIREENEDIILLHSHEVRAWDVKHSYVQIINKANGKRLKQIDTTPFKKIIAIKGTDYFIGLSDLLAGSMKHGYNFAIIDSRGNLLTTAFINKDSGHCKKVRQSVSQYIGWYSPNTDVKLVKDKERLMSLKLTLILTQTSIA